MTPSEMEEQIKNLNQWASEVAHYLPLLATKEDLKAFATVAKLATKEELRAGLEDAKRYTEDLIVVTRREIRQVDDKVTSIAADVRQIAEQVAILARRQTKKK
jgi:DNA-binding transcriptional regulator WhiA